MIAIERYLNLLRREQRLLTELEKVRSQLPEAKAKYHQALEKLAREAKIYEEVEELLK